MEKTYRIRERLFGNDRRTNSRKSEITNLKGSPSFLFHAPEYEGTVYLLHVIRVVKVFGIRNESACTTYLSVDYFPLTVNFFDRDAIELAEAKYGIRVDGAVCKLLCKIFKEGYYIPWGVLNFKGSQYLKLLIAFFVKESFVKQNLNDSVYLFSIRLI